MTTPAEEVVTMGDLQALTATHKQARWAISGKLDSMKDFNWYNIMSRAVTVIRKDFPVTKLQSMADEGNVTAVSGDVIVELRKP